MVSEESSTGKISPSLIPIREGRVVGLNPMPIRSHFFIAVAVVLLSFAAQPTFGADKLRISSCGGTIAVLLEYAMICKLC